MQTEEALPRSGVTSCFPKPTVTLKDPAGYYIDIARLLDMVMLDDVEVSGTETVPPVADMSIERRVSIGYMHPTTYHYAINRKNPDMVVSIDYKKEGNNRTITSINIEKNAEITTLYQNDIGPIQGSELLIRCNMKVAAEVARFKAEKQKKFDRLF